MERESPSKSYASHSFILLEGGSGWDDWPLMIRILPEIHHWGVRLSPGWIRSQRVRLEAAALRMSGQPILDRGI